MAATAASVEQPVSARKPDASEIAAAQAYDHANATLRRSPSVDGSLSGSGGSNSGAMLEGYTVWRPHRRNAGRRRSRSRTASDPSNADGRETPTSAPAASFDWARDGSPRFHDSGPLLAEPFSSDPALWDVDARSTSPRRRGPVCPLDALFGRRGDAEADEAGVPPDGPDLADFPGGMEGDIMKAAATAATTVDSGDTVEVGYLEQLRQRVLALNTVRTLPPACAAVSRPRAMCTVARTSTWVSVECAWVPDGGELYV